MNYKYENALDLRLLRKANNHRENSVCIWKQIMLTTSYSQLCPLFLLLKGALQYKTITSIMVDLFSFNATTDTVSLDNV